MVTDYSKPVERRRGDLIATLADGHFEIRRAGHQTRARVSFADMLAVLEAANAPRGWVPAIGETVAVGGNRHRARVQAIVPCTPELLARVRFPGGCEKMVELSTLVPVGNRTVTIQCQRIAKGILETEREPGPLFDRDWT